MKALKTISGSGRRVGVEVPVHRLIQGRFCGKSPWPSLVHANRCGWWQRLCSGRAKWQRKVCGGFLQPRLDVDAAEFAPVIRSQSWARHKLRAIPPWRIGPVLWRWEGQIPLFRAAKRENGQLADRKCPVEFEIPMFTYSGLKVTYLRVDEDVMKYT